MLRLPDLNALGNRPTPRGNRAIVSQDTTAVGKAIAGLGQEIGAFGEDINRANKKAEQEAELQRKKADQATAIVKINGVRDQLADIEMEFDEGIKTGQIDKTKALDLFKQRTSDVIGKGVTEVPEAHRQLGRSDLDSMSERLARKVQGNLFRRDQSDTAAAIGQTVEYAQRLATTQPEIGRKLGVDTIEQLGAFAGWTPAQVATERQKFKEGVSFTQAYTILNESKDNNKALADVEKRLKTDEFSDLDPQRKAQLLTTLDGYRLSNVQRAEADARRRQAEQERALRLAESQFNAAQSIITSGKVLSPDYVAQVSQSVRGTPYELAFKEALKVPQEHIAFGSQPLAVQQAVLQQARGQLNTSGTRPESEKQFASLQKIADDQARDFAADPMSAALNYGVVQQLAPLDTRSLPGLMSTLGARAGQADLVRQKTGAGASPFTSDEAESFGQMLSAMSPKQRSVVIGQVSQTVGPQTASAIARQLGAKDRATSLAFATGSSMTTEGRYTSELILSGAQAIKDKAVKEDSQVMTGLRASIAAMVGDALPGKAREDVVDAARLIYLGLEAEGGANVQQAVRLAIGGDIVEHNGRKVPVPVGFDEETLANKVRAVPFESISKQAPDGFVYLPGGRPMGVPEFMAALPEAQLEPAGMGKYMVRSGGSLVLNQARRPIVIEVQP